MSPKESSGDFSMDTFDVMGLSSSPYSPQALLNMPQPKPKDLPSHLDSSVFTFQDAFEDLLEVSQGKPLPNITSRFEQAKMLRQMFPNGEPTWFWLRRLESQGLLRTPHSTFQISSTPPDWQQFHRQLRESTDKVWRAIRDDMNELASTDFHPQGREPVSLRHDQSQRGTKLPNHPDTFDELYESLESTFADDQKSWDAFRNSMASDSNPRTRQSAPITAGSDVLAETQTETREEYIDKFGFLHTTVRKKILGKDGNEVSNEVYVNIRSADENDRKRVESEKQGDSPQGGEKKGWFWK